MYQERGSRRFRETDGEARVGSMTITSSLCQRAADADVSHSLQVLPVTVSLRKAPELIDF